MTGQDPGFSNRGSAMSHTHMWVWLRFCIAALYCSTGSQVKGKKHITGERLKNTPFECPYHVFLSLRLKVGRWPLTLI